MICVALGCASFNFSTLEEYYTGGLFLGPFNAISDGSIVYIGLNILMAIFGNKFWITTIQIGYKNEYVLVELLKYFIFIVTPAIISLCFKEIFRH